MDVAKLHKALDEKHKRFVKGLDNSLMEKITLDRSFFIDKTHAAIEEILNILLKCGAIDCVIPRPFDKFNDSVVLFEVVKEITPSFSPHLQIKAEFPNKIVFSDKSFYINESDWEEKFSYGLLDHIHDKFFQSKQYTDMLVSKKLGTFNSKRKKK